MFSEGKQSPSIPSILWTSFDVPGLWRQCTKYCLLHWQPSLKEHLQYGKHLTLSPGFNWSPSYNCISWFCTPFFRPRSFLSLINRALWDATTAGSVSAWTLQNRIWCIQQYILCQQCSTSCSVTHGTGFVECLNQLPHFNTMWHLGLRKYRCWTSSVYFLQRYTFSNVSWLTCYLSRPGGLEHYLLSLILTRCT